MAFELLHHHPTPPRTLPVSPGSGHYRSGNSVRDHLTHLRHTLCWLLGWGPVPPVIGLHDRLGYFERVRERCERL